MMGHRTLIGILGILAGLCPFLLGTPSFSADTPAAGSASDVVKGDVLDQEGEYYVIKEITGRERRVHVNADTRMEDRIKVGDKIEAHVASDGHAKSMKVQIPEAAPNSPASSGTLKERQDYP